ncbi:PAS domain S-box protein [Segnochrobactraceae bacterium EtOH-i3]
MVAPTTNERSAFLILALCLALVAGYWLHLENSFNALRQATLDDARVRASQLVESVGQQFELTFRSADFVLRDVRQTYLETSQNFLPMSRRALSVLPASAEATLTLYDADGMLIASSNGRIAALSIADQDYFIAQRTDATADRIVIGRPGLSRLTGRWELPLTRPILIDGTFAGVLMMSVSPFYFSQEMAQIGVAPDDSVGAVHYPDGYYIARNTGILDLLGKHVDPVRPYLQPGAPPRGTFTAVASYEPIERLYAWKRLPDKPVVAFVGLAIDEILEAVDQDITRSRRDNLIGTLLFMVLAALAAALAIRMERQSRDLRRQEQLYHNLFEQNHSVKLITDPSSGAIVAANQAACEFYGYERDKLQSMKISDINCLPPDEIAVCMNDAQGNRRPSFLFPHRLANGEIRRVEVYSGPVEVEGRPLLYSIIHDVTDRFLLEDRLRASEARYRTMFDVVPDGMMLIDADGSIVAWNSAALALLDVDESGLTGRTRDLYTRDERRISLAERPSVRATREEISGELYFLSDRQARRRWLAVNSRRLPAAANGRGNGAVVSFSDITRVVQLEESLLISQSVFESAAEGIMVTDASRVIRQVNPAFTDITGYSAEEVLGKIPRLLSSGEHDAGFYAALYESLESKRHWEGEVTNRHKSGMLYIERLVITALTRPDNTVWGYVAMLSDITERKRREVEIWHRANFDALTGLPNRTLLLDRIEQALAQSARREQHVGVLFIDLDRFKPVNDTYGHAVGDELLRQVARRIADCVRTEDTVARLGGDEFVVLLPGVPLADDAIRVAEKILARLNEPFVLATATVSVGACIGVVTRLGGTADAATLLKLSDAAMYQAKAAGRGRVHVAPPDNDALAD